MNNKETQEYSAIIKKIRQKRKVVTTLTIIALFIAIVFCSPAQIVLFDETVLDYKGVSPVITVLIALLILVLELIAHAIVSAPLTTSMDVECDPEKHLTLNMALNKQKNKDYICAIDFFYLGSFRVALDYANKMIAVSKPAMVVAGLFNKSRCEFFLGDFVSLKETQKQYESILSNIEKIRQKEKDSYIKIQKIINLMVALSDEDTEKISAYRNIEAWNNSKANEGFLNYLKGLAAYIMEEKEEAIYRFMWVKENCGKTVLSQLAGDYLLKLSTSAK